jgi:hypothetical protein
MTNLTGNVHLVNAKMPTSLIKALYSEEARLGLVSIVQKFDVPMEFGTTRLCMPDPHDLGRRLEKLLVHCLDTQTVAFVTTCTDNPHGPKKQTTTSKGCVLKGAFLMPVSLHLAVFRASREDPTKFLPHTPLKAFQPTDVQQRLDNPDVRTYQQSSVIEEMFYGGETSEESQMTHRLLELMRNRRRKQDCKAQQRQDMSLTEPSFSSLSLDGIFSSILNSYYQTLYGQTSILQCLDVFNVLEFSDEQEAGSKLLVCFLVRCGLDRSNDMSDATEPCVQSGVQGGADEG